MHKSAFSLGIRMAKQYAVGCQIEYLVQENHYLHYDFEIVGHLPMNLSIIVWKNMVLVAAKLMPSTIFADHDISGNNSQTFRHGNSMSL